MLVQARERLGKQPLTRDVRPRLKHIMIISDEPELAESIQIDLHGEGYQVSVINDGLRGLSIAKRVATDLIVVGWAPPSLSGLEICRRLRAGQGEEPIILLTQADSPCERIAGLEAGADDCVSIPFDPEELIARIHASLQRRSSVTAQSAILQCANIQLNRKTREVFRDIGDASSANKQLIRLTAKEFDLLEYLMSHYFQVLTRTQILENVWGYEYSGSSNIIEVYIRYLRRKLEENDASRLIHTVRSVGYIFREEDTE
ncbi:MAG: response regulator transcription factor [Cyanobacteria bacterium P01_C01_bin.121]